MGTASIDRIARESYSRLLAYVAARSGGDIAAAEDALAGAFVAALESWTPGSTPSNPEAWLVSVAKRKLIDSQRREETRQRHSEALRTAIEAADMEIDEGDGIPDERLQLLFACTHPSIAPESRTPLMLQVVLGLDAARIAPAFLLSPSAMAQRLVRAKSKIRAAAIPYRIPGRHELSARVDAVLDSIYVAYTSGWQQGDENLATEATWLAEVVVQLLPDSAEAIGLRSLLTYCEARRESRHSPDGTYIPLHEQDTTTWDEHAILSAESLLERASTLKAPGRFQTEAAIQSVHVERRITGVTRWREILLLYRVLEKITGSVGAKVSAAVAQSKVDGPEPALAALRDVPEKTVAHFQPYWAAKAFLLQQLGDPASTTAYEKAIALTTCESERRFLRRKARSFRPGTD